MPPVLQICLHDLLAMRVPHRARHAPLAEISGFCRTAGGRLHHKREALRAAWVIFVHALAVCQLKVLFLSARRPWHTACYMAGQTGFLDHHAVESVTG
jgi:hypothetical protein